MDLGIAGKVALVAAASKGFGRAIATQLAAEGCRVALCARTRDTLEQTACEIAEQVKPTNPAPEILPIVADVADENACRNFVQAAADKWGSIDILVTNTGGPTPGTFDTTEDTAWLAAQQNTLMNVVHLIRLCLPHMKRNNWGRIVNITSISAKQPIDGLLLSNTFRPAIIGLAKTLSIELGPHNILVNNICPGSHLTDRLHELAEVRAAKNNSSVEQEFEAMAANCPLGRLGDPKELADVVTFLCSNRAGYVNGQSIAVDGGTYRGIA